MHKNQQLKKFEERESFNKHKNNNQHNHKLL
jgi:hypothetical protein